MMTRTKKTIAGRQSSKRDETLVGSVRTQIKAVV
jgi:hypothetical protein